jgi:glutamine---fructose-6-phosphate transaminase (isomerizing)
MTPTLRSITGQFPYWRKARMPAKLQDPTRTRVVIGCGTSYNLALSIAAALNLQRIAAIAVPAGEWLIRPEAYSPENGVEVIALSRSGETTETVAAARASRARGQWVTGITCAPGSALSTVSDTILEFDTHPEEGIVMTASASLMLLAGYAMAGEDGFSTLAARAETLMAAFAALPMTALTQRSHFVFLGGGTHYGVALEGALKLQEMALCYTQGFHPGEYRHGPVSLVDERTAVVMLYSAETAADEAVLAAELQAKGALVLGIGGPGTLSLPTATPGIGAGAEMLPLLQLLGERYAAAKGLDTSAPRHLTKVVMLP